MLPSRALACLVLAGSAAWGGDVLLSASAADGPALAGRWAASPYGALWRDPAFAGIRGAVVARLSALAGADPTPWFATARGARLAIAGGPQPVLAMGCELGADAPAILAAARARGALPAALAGADPAVRFPGGMAIGLVGGRVAATTAGEEPGGLLAPLPAPAAGEDLVIRLDPAALAAQLAPDAGVVQAMRGFLAGFGPATAALSLLPTGIGERAGGTLLRPLPGYAPVDRRVLDRLPARTLAVVAVGVDGPAWWQAHRQALFAAAAQLDGSRSPGAGLPADQGGVILDGWLGSMGIAATAEDIAAACTGTMAVAATSGTPLPGVAIIVPRGKGTDALAAWVARLGKAAAPATGGSVAIVLPGLPLPATLVAGDGHWLLTTDQDLAGAWVAGGSGGWSTSRAGAAALAAAPPSAVLIGASDTPAVMRTLSGFLGIGLAAAGLDAAAQQQAAAAALRLADLAGTGHCHLDLSPAAWRWESRGLVGGLGALALMAPIGVAAIATPEAPAPARGVEL